MVCFTLQPLQVSAGLSETSVHTCTCTHSRQVLGSPLTVYTDDQLKDLASNTVALGHDLEAAAPGTHAAVRAPATASGSSIPQRGRRTAGGAAIGDGRKRWRLPREAEECTYSTFAVAQSSWNARETGAAVVSTSG